MPKAFFILTPAWIRVLFMMMELSLDALLKSMSVCGRRYHYGNSLTCFLVSEVVEYIATNMHSVSGLSSELSV